jgi:phospholipase/carboxylesterase
MTRLLAAALVAVLGFASCGGGGNNESASPTKERAQARANAATQGRLTARPPETPPKGGPTGLRHLGPALLYVPPGDGPKRLVLTLHGATETPQNALMLLRPYAKDQGLILLAPKSQAVTWDVVAQGGFGPDVAAIDRLLEQVFAEYPVEDVAAAGFSDGASYALSLGLTNGDLFTHAVAFSPGFLVPAELHGSPRIFISHGTRDQILPIDRCSRRIVPHLKDRGYDVRYLEFDGTHEVPAEMVREAVNWLLPPTRSRPR